MYTLVLAMALNAPATNPDYPTADPAVRPTSQQLYRGNGCCGGGNGCCCGGYGCSGYGCHGGRSGGCHGGGWSCGGGWGCSGAGPVTNTMMYPPNEPARMPEPLPAPMTRATQPAPATLIVNMPADAVLTIDDAATTALAARRTFVSPPLEPGVEYHYNLKMQVQRNGEKVEVAKRVAVRAGEQTEVTLETPPAGVARR